MSPSSPAGSSSSSLPTSNALLALPDGMIPAGHADLESYTLSFIGGYPTFPALPDLPKEVKCGICHSTIPLLAQVYCPPEDGENDRTVYVWACPRRRCQRRDGSIRAFRASRRNEEYVKDVEEKRRIAEKEREEERARARINPFAMPNGQPTGSLFGSSQPLFGAAPPAVSSSSAPPDLTSLSITSPSTASSYTLAPPLPAYQPPQYLSTISEYLPPIEPDSDDEDDDEDAGFAELKDEKWEKILAKSDDEVFEAFVRRLDAAEDGNSQVLRYELGGIPLPYSSTSPLFKKLFPNAPIKIGPKTALDETEDIPSYYNPKAAIPPCPRCHGPRVFELQIVPSLLNILRPDTLSTTGRTDAQNGKKEVSEEERKKELSRLAGLISGELQADAEAEDENVEMEWGNIMVFGCESDCVGFGEEWVGVEWETVGL